MISFFNIAQAQAPAPALTAQDRQLLNPLASEGVGSIPDLLYALVNVLLVLAVPLIIFYLIYAGFNYVLAQGNPTKVQEASKQLLYGLIGAVVVFGAFAILAIVTNTVCQFGVASSSSICTER